MQQRLPLLAAHVVVIVAEHEAHRREEVALARPIAPDDDITPGREGLDLRLVLVTAGSPSAAQWQGGFIAIPLEALDCDLLDEAHD